MPGPARHLPGYIPHRVSIDIKERCVLRCRSKHRLVGTTVKGGLHMMNLSIVDSMPFCNEHRSLGARLRRQFKKDRCIVSFGNDFLYMTNGNGEQAGECCHVLVGATVGLKKSYKLQVIGHAVAG